MVRVLAVALLTMVSLPAVTPLQAADHYKIDPAHTDVSFKISHLGLARILGRFDEFAGEFTIDKANPANSSFELTIKVDSIDTNQKQRDEHLRTADFFDAKQYPEITFKSTSVKPLARGLEVTGNFTLHGVTKPLTMVLIGGGSAEFPEGVLRTGYTTDLVIKRTDFGMKNFIGVVGDEVEISVSFEGTRSK